MRNVQGDIGKIDFQQNYHLDFPDVAKAIGTIALCSNNYTLGR